MRKTLVKYLLLKKYMLLLFFIIFLVSIYYILFFRLLPQKVTYYLNDLNVYSFILFFNLFWLNLFKAITVFKEKNNLLIKILQKNKTRLYNLFYESIKNTETFKAFFSVFAINNYNKFFWLYLNILIQVLVLTILYGELSVLKYLNMFFYFIFCFNINFLIYLMRYLTFRHIEITFEKKKIE